MSQTTTTMEQKQLPTIEEVNLQESLDQMELIARKSLAIHLKSLKIDFTSTALDEIFHLFNMYLNSTLTDLSKLVQTQRRFKVSPNDLKILFREHDVNMGDLFTEVTNTKKNLTNDNSLIQKKNGLRELAKQYHLKGDTIVEDEEPEEQLDLAHSASDANDPSYVFFANNQDLSDLIPSSHKRGKRIPKWFPQFPPDHTYLKTPNYTNRITDQKVVRTKIAEESAFGERALDNLIKYENEKQEAQLNDELETTKENDINVQGDLKLTREESATLWTPGLEKKLDIPKYAKIRAKYLEIEKKKAALKESKIDHNYNKIINQLSSYPTSVKYDITENLPISPAEFLENQLNKATSSLYSLKKKKADRDVERAKFQKEESIRIAKVRAEQSKLQKQKEQEEREKQKLVEQNNANENGTDTGKNTEANDEEIDEEANLFNNFENFDESVDNFEFYV